MILGSRDHGVEQEMQASPKALVARLFDGQSRPSTDPRLRSTDAAMLPRSRDWVGTITALNAASNRKATSATDVTSYKSTQMIDVPASRQVVVPHERAHWSCRIGAVRSAPTTLRSVSRSVRSTMSFTTSFDLRRCPSGPWIRERRNLHNEDATG